MSSKEASDVIVNPEESKFSNDLKVEKLDWDLAISKVTEGLDPLLPSKNVITLYPNPSTGVLNVKSDKIVIQQVEIFDISGRRVFNEKINVLRKELNLNSLNSGSYWVIVHSEGDRHLEKIILMK